MSKWSERWNELPEEIRRIGSITEAEMRINQLKAEKARLEKSYRRNIDEINNHIANLEKFIKREDAQEPA